MAGQIPRAFIEQLLAQTDIVQVIGQRVPLKKAGRNYVACCPFHSEKTPSFNVIPSKQFYHCFGCGASGDAIKFLQEYDGLSFTDAVEALAQQVGLQVPYQKLTPEQAQRQKAQATLYDLMAHAARFYRQQLRDHPDAEAAKAYLRQRGLTPEIAKRYYLGFAPPGWSSLDRAFTPITDYEEALETVGLRIRKEGKQGTYDRFRNRIMFPIRDVRGRVLGFGGRVLGDEKPKYLNSPESPIFHKGQVLYGLYEMHQARVKADLIIVVEGYMDVIALAQHGFPNAVATLGTAVTEAHLDRLYREVNTVVFSFDGDAAGRKAAWKAVELLLPRLNERQSARFLFLPPGEDPDSWVRKQGKAGFQQQLDSAPPLVDFVVEQIVAALPVPLSEQEGRRLFLAEIKPWLQRAKGWYQSALAEQAAGALGIPAWRLGRELGIYLPYARSEGVKKPQWQAPPVVGLAHRLARHLLAEPARARAWFSADDVALLRAAPVEGAPMLAWLIETLLNDADEATVVQALREHGQEALVTILQRLELPPPGENRDAEFQALLQRLIEAIELATTDDISAIAALKRGE
ncbi:DNA primase [Sulfurivirga caldicuralii]|uniref:DNA primase n=1 Tax=Sulfurivirga caldicuralii TaxID=364032 RepID=A0A1N6GN11_9GAMM|nr:DNA primase [Sulfurivirga caldicuralii]SIO08939.1 DNA primase [Sulfurivirga caldicuralii]